MVLVMLLHPLKMDGNIGPCPKKDNNNLEYLSRITLQYKVLLSTGSCKLDLD